MFTKAKIINHFRYSFWMYLLVVVLSVAFWNILYTATAYQPPADKKLEIIIAENSQADQDALQSIVQNIHQEKFSHLEEVSVHNLLSSVDQAYYTDIQLQTYIMANQGDIYILGKERFRSFGALGAFVDLTPYIENGTIQISPEDSNRAKLIIKTEDETDTVSIAGISLRNAKGLAKLGINTRDSYIAVVYNSGNLQNAVDFINALIHIE